MKLIMENWRTFLNELDLTDPDLAYVASATDSEDAQKRAAAIQDVYTSPAAIESAMLLLNFIPAGLIAGVLTKSGASAILRLIKSPTIADDLVRLANKLRKAVGKEPKMRNAPIKARDPFLGKGSLPPGKQKISKEDVPLPALSKPWSPGTPEPFKLSPRLQKKFDEVQDFVRKEASKRSKTIDQRAHTMPKELMPSPTLKNVRTEPLSIKLSNSKTIPSPPPIPKK